MIDDCPAGRVLEDVMCDTRQLDWFVNQTVDDVATKKSFCVVAVWSTQKLSLGPLLAKDLAKVVVSKALS